MKKLLVCLLFAGFGTTLSAQHVVVLKSGETMNGEVKSLNDGAIKFSFKGNDMTLKVADVSSIQFAAGAAPASSGTTTATTTSTKGVTYVMNGRKMVKQPKIDNLTMEKGVVVVEITINKYGNVIKAVPGIEGTSTTSTYLQTKAKQAAESVTFDTNPTMPLEQKGTITITF